MNIDRFIISLIIVMIGTILIFALINYNNNSSGVKMQIISENTFLSQGMGFDFVADKFTIEDLKKLQEKIKTLDKIRYNSKLSLDETRNADKEYNELLLRLQNPFQTGVPYDVAKVLHEKMLLRETLLENKNSYDGEYPENHGAWHISDIHQAIKISIKPEYFTSINIEKYDQFVREYLGNKVNILYEK